jgi:uncharacterized protein (TIGR02145 family)
MRILTLPQVSKALAFFFLEILISTLAVAQPSGTFTDSRDGQSYAWSRLSDGKKWMTQNLNFELTTGQSWCYDNDTALCDSYGRLYDWETAKKACPVGWRLPRRDDFVSILNRYGEGEYDGINNSDWYYYFWPRSAYSFLMSKGEGSFYGKLGGQFDSNLGKFSKKGEIGFFWSSSQEKISPVNVAVDVWFLKLNSQRRLASMEFIDSQVGLSVRCLQD